MNNLFGNDSRALSGRMVVSRRIPCGIALTRSALGCILVAFQATA